MTANDCQAALAAERAKWGDRLLILGHHYQDSSVVALCDAVGDSLELSRIAAQSTAERIVFCGVRFMAETADILARGPVGGDNGRTVWLPAPKAGCPMADMATAEALESAWARLVAADPKAAWVPVVYVNSSAEVKAFCGRHGGMACTSGNATKVLGHLFATKRKVFFAPDQHLCANTAHLLGLPADAVALWRRALDNGGLDATRIRAAKAVAWDGCCPIHAGYTPGDVATARTRHPGAELLIHPEAPVKVAALAEAVGSTKAIIEAVSRAEPGTHLLIGTEEHLVRRLAAVHPDLDIHPLRPIICQDMGRTTPEALLRVLQAWPDDTRVRVPDALLPDAHACVQRMLALA